MKSCTLSRCKRESGSNPEQPPLLYLTSKRIIPLGFFPEKVRFLRLCCRCIISQDTCRIFKRFNMIGREECNRLQAKIALAHALFVLYRAKVYLCDPVFRCALSVLAERAFFSERRIISFFWFSYNINTAQGTAASRAFCHLKAEAVEWERKWTDVFVLGLTRPS